MSEKKLAGLWIDQKKAIIVKNNDGQNVSEFEIFDTVKSENTDANSSEYAFHNSENAHKEKYFKEIEKAITNSVELFVTGPGVAQEELKNHLLETAQYKNLKITLDSSQQMSDEQVLEAVKSHFNA